MKRNPKHVSEIIHNNTDFFSEYYGSKFATKKRASAREEKRNRRESELFDVVSEENANCASPQKMEEGSQPQNLIKDPEKLKEIIHSSLTSEHSQSAIDQTQFSTLKAFASLTEENQKRGLTTPIIPELLIVLLAAVLSGISLGPFLESSREASPYLPENLFTALGKLGGKSKQEINGVIGAPSSVAVNGLLNFYFNRMLTKDFIDFLRNNKYKDLEALKKISPASFDSLLKKLLENLPALFLSATSTAPFCVVAWNFPLAKNLIVQILEAGGTAASFGLLHLPGGLIIQENFIYPPVRRLVSLHYSKEERDLIARAKKLQQAFINTLTAARQEIGQRIQLGPREELQELFDALNKGSIEALIKLCEKAPAVTPTSRTQKIANGIALGTGNLVLGATVLTSQFGYFMKTTETAGDWVGEYGRWALGSAMYSSFGMLALLSSKTMIDNLWGLTKSVTLGSAQRLRYKFIGGEPPTQPMVAMSPSAQQHKLLMLLTLVTAYNVAWASSGPAQMLNHDTLEDFKVAWAAEAWQYSTWPTSVGTALFNGTPFGPLLSEGSRMYEAQFGSEETKENLRLLQFIDHQIELAGEMPPEIVVQLFFGLTKLAELLQEGNAISDADEFLSLFFQRQSVEDLFGVIKKQAPSEAQPKANQKKSKTNDQSGGERESVTYTFQQSWGDYITDLHTEYQRNFPHKFETQSQSNKEEKVLEETSKEIPKEVQPETTKKQSSTNDQSYASRLANWCCAWKKEEDPLKKEILEQDKEDSKEEDDFVKVEF